MVDILTVGITTVRNALGARYQVSKNLCLRHETLGTLGEVYKLLAAFRTETSQNLKNSVEAKKEKAILYHGLSLYEIRMRIIWAMDLIGA